MHFASLYFYGVCCNDSGTCFYTFSSTVFEYIDKTFYVIGIFRHFSIIICISFCVLFLGFFIILCFAVSFFLFFDFALVTLCQCFTCFLFVY